MLPPARQANEGAGSLVPRLETPPTPDGCGPPLQPRLPAWPGPTPAAYAPARGATQSLGCPRRSSMRRRVHTWPLRPGGTERARRQSNPLTRGWEYGLVAGPRLAPPDTAAGPGRHSPTARVVVESKHSL